MIRRKYGFIVLFCMVLSALYCVPCFAAEWVLGEVYLEDIYQEDYLEDYSIATDSNASRGIMLLSAHDPYDTGSISTSVVSYMSDVIPKMGNVHYVLFRSDQYKYRLYYSKELEYTGGGYFTADSTEFVEYDSRYYTWLQGTESNFSLSAGNTMVYSDLGGYPMLSSGDTSTWMLVVLGAIYLVFVIVRSFLAPSKFVI